MPMPEANVVVKPATEAATGSESLPAAEPKQSVGRQVTDDEVFSITGVVPQKDEEIEVPPSQESNEPVEPVPSEKDGETKGDQEQLPPSKTDEEVKPSKDDKPDEVKDEIAEIGVNEIEEFTKELGLTPVDPVKDKIADDASTEDIQKTIDPTGKTSIEDQLKNAQTLIGKQSSEVNEARKISQAFDQFLVRDSGGQPQTIDLFKLSDLLGEEEVSRQLNDRGMKLVPLDYQGDAEFPDDLVNQIEPDSSLTLEEKRELIKATPEKLVKLTLEKEKRINDKKIQQARLAERDEAEVEQALKDLSDKKDFETLKPVMAEWNKRIPKDVKGKFRIEAMYKFAKLDNMGNFLETFKNKIVKETEKLLLNKLRLSGASDPGSVLTSSNESTGENNTGKEVMPEDVQKAFF